MGSLPIWPNKSINKEKAILELLGGARCQNHNDLYPCA